MSWKTEYRCVNCEAVLGEFVRMYSDGRCPECGFKGKSAGTIVDTTEHAYRNKRGGRWWQFWKQPSRVYLQATGFSLVELLVVVSIIGILASIVIPYGFCALEKARFVVYETDMKRAQSDLEGFRADNPHYPESLQELYPDGRGPQGLLYQRGSDPVSEQGLSRRGPRIDDTAPSKLPQPDPGGYLLQTVDNLCPGCIQIDLLFVGPGMGPIQQVLFPPLAPNPDLGGEGGEAGPVVCMGPSDPGCPDPLRN